MDNPFMVDVLGCHPSSPSVVSLSDEKDPCKKLHYEQDIMDLDLDDSQLSSKLKHISDKNSSSIQSSAMGSSSARASSLFSNPQV